MNSGVLLKPTFCAALLCLLWISCSEDNLAGTGAAPGVQIGLGTIWSYGGSYTTRNKSDRFDTTYMYSVLRYERDTVIAEGIYKVFEGTAWQCHELYVDTLHLMDFVSISDSQVRVLSPRQDVPLPGMTVFKRRLDTLRYDRSIEYDTIRFADLKYPLFFPLSDSQSWFLRPLYCPSYNMPMIRRFLGEETVDVHGGTFKTWKFNDDYRLWCRHDSLVGCISPEAYCTTWVAAIGNVKMHVILRDAGSFRIHPPSVVDAYSEFLGHTEVAASLANPLLATNVIDSVFGVVQRMWSFSRFGDWFTTLPPETLYTYQDEPYWSELADFMEGVWHKPLHSIDSAVAQFSLAQFPQAPGEFSNFGRFASAVIVSDLFDVGWEDCALEQDIACTSETQTHLRSIVK